MKKIKYLIIAYMVTLTACFDEQELIISDDFKYVAFDVTSVEVIEGEVSTVNINLLYSGRELSTDLSIPISVLDVSSNQAEDGVDYLVEEGLGNIRIPAGEFTKRITISIVNNSESVGLRELKLNIGEIEGFNIGAPDNPESVAVTIRIVEDDLTLLAFSSFEQVDLSGRSLEYSKNGTAILENNPGEAPVDFLATGSELGFDSSFDLADIGDSGREFIGVGAVTDLNVSDPADIPSTPFAYLDGVQGYHGNDIDGTLEIVFDEVTFPSNVSLIEFSVGVFIGGFNADAGEGIECVWRTSAGDTLLFVIEDSGEIESDGSPIYLYNGVTTFPRVSWQTLRVSPDPSSIDLTGNVVIRMDNDNDADAYFVDALSISYVL